MHTHARAINTTNTRNISYIVIRNAYEMLLLRNILNESNVMYEICIECMRLCN